MWSYGNQTIIIEYLIHLFCISDSLEICCCSYHCVVIATNPRSSVQYWRTSFFRTASQTIWFWSFYTNIVNIKLVEYLESGHQIFCIFVGFLYAFIFGQVTSIIQQLQMPSSIYHQKLNSIRRFIKLYSVPDDIGARLIDYFMTTWRRNKGLEIEEVCWNNQ